MNRIQLAQLRDIAIEYLPDAQKERDNFKQWAKVKRLGSRDYALRLYQAASCSLGDASLPAVEIAAANLMQALVSWETYDPNDVPQDYPTPDEIRKICMEKIKETANTLAEVTGRDIPLVDPAMPVMPAMEQIELSLADAQAAKVGAVPDKTLLTLLPRTNKIRKNTLDPAIDKAIKKAGNMKTADVYLSLKELAKDEEPPFTGVFAGDALCYTDTNDKPAKLTKEALGKRLRRAAEKAAAS